MKIDLVGLCAAIDFIGYRGSLIRFFRPDIFPSHSKK